MTARYADGHVAPATVGRSVLTDADVGHEVRLVANCDSGICALGRPANWWWGAGTAIVRVLKFAMSGSFGLGAIAIGFIGVLGVPKYYRLVDWLGSKPRPVRLQQPQ